MAEVLNLPAWPALDMQGVEPPSELVFGRAVWGKVHGAESDFRWIAVGANFDASSKIEGELGLGSEDAPLAGQAWRSLDENSCAVGFYPSRARDSAGRSGFLEKQILLWRRPAGIPAALGAFMLLPLAARASDDVWWERRSEPRLHDPDFRLELSNDLEVPLLIDAREIAVRLEGGRRQLLEQVSEPALADLYAALLAGRRAIPLDLRKPFAPEALAALLLPLPRSIADRLSIAGWLPSTRAVTELGRHWDVIATDRPTELAAVGPKPSAQQKREGKQMAAALSVGRASRDAVPDIAAPRTSSGDEVQIALWGPAAAGKTVLLAQLYLGRAESRASTDWKSLPTAASLEFGTSMRRLVDLSNRFPTATPRSLTDRLVYQFHKSSTGVRASLIIEDRAGHHSEQLDDHARERLSSAHGLVLILDPRRDGTRFQVEIEQTLDEVFLAREGTVLQDDRPLAVCISKADLLIKAAEDAWFARTQPDNFVRQRVPGVDRLIQAIDRFCTNYRFFPVSAAGLRLRHGAVEPTVFYDENLDLRIRGLGSPFNLMAPFAWVLDQVTAR